MMNTIRSSIIESIEAKQNLLDDMPVLNSIQSVTEAVLDVYRSGHKVLIAGNGGSAADAQHIAAEFVSRFMIDRPGLPAIALTTDTSMLTAIGNDYGFDQVFSRQVQANGVSGDIVFLISTSGQSTNLLLAAEEARRIGVKTVALCAQKGPLREICDFSIEVPSHSTPRIQECHILIGHIICDMVERTLFAASDVAQTVAVDSEG